MKKMNNWQLAVYTNGVLDYISYCTAKVTLRKYLRSDAFNALNTDTEEVILNKNFIRYINKNGDIIEEKIIHKDDI